jgi:hypothetical protein
VTRAVNPDTYIGRTAVDPQREKIGAIGQAYVNDQTGDRTGSP